MIEEGKSITVVSEQDALSTLRGCEHDVLMRAANTLWELGYREDAGCVYDAAYARFQIEASDKLRDYWVTHYEKRTSGECMKQYGTPF